MFSAIILRCPVLSPARNTAGAMAVCLFLYPSQCCEETERVLLSLFCLMYLSQKKALKNGIFYALSSLHGGNTF